MTTFYTTTDKNVESVEDINGHKVRVGDTIRWTAQKDNRGGWIGPVPHERAGVVLEIRAHQKGKRAGVIYLECDTYFSELEAITQDRSAVGGLGCVTTVYPRKSGNIFRIEKIL